ncbi:MAG TPA: AraC family transcriptional regulator [Bacteroidia bacterium]
MGNLSLLNLITAIFGFVIAGMLLFSSVHNRKVNFILGIAFTALSYRSLNIYLLQIDAIPNNFLIGRVSFVYYLISPSIYLYFRKMIDDKPFQKKDLIHMLMPALAFLLPFAYGLFNYSSNGHFHIPSQELIDEQNNQIPFYIPLIAHIYMLFAASTIYLIISWYMVIKKLPKQNNEHPQINKVRNWIWTILIIFTLLFVLLFLSAILNWAWHYETKIGIAGLNFIRSVVLLFLFSRVLIESDLLFGIPSLPSSLPVVEHKEHTFETLQEIKISENVVKPIPLANQTETVKTTPTSELNFDKYGWVKGDQDVSNALKTEVAIENEKVSQYILLINEYMGTQPFTDPDFNMKSISNQLQVPHYHIEYLFRYYNQYAFTEFRNMLRVNYVIEQIEKGSHNNLTIEGIGKNAGFSSRSSFFRVFKQMTGKTPKQYAGSDEDGYVDDDN